MQSRSLAAASAPPPAAASRGSVRGTPPAAVRVRPGLDPDPLLAGLPVAEPAQDAVFLIGAHDDAYDLRPPGEHARPGIQAVFPPDRGQRGGRNPLLRAFGRRLEAIVDLTAGLGADAYRLARAGHRVRGLERDPAVYALLASGWARALRRGQVPQDVAQRLSFERGEAGEVVAGLDALDLGVYVDPMYPPPRRASARPRRELQVLRALLGAQDDAAALVAAARTRAARVVVKRPHHAEPLAPGASFEVETKLVRFDVYLNPERMRTRSA